ncbi:hypothetical protein CROQUDRAFT_109262 [Cronartium quercuum f. sp. fusiforme G11]|uniref:Uncharacterized protein n=1 Tax=Cronartium quercuum f. sp. fusiforme G11 TaxID=708437 RepID=A0A9P6NG43_9BASI|nr:hypothetical protein CROQUDRAFT_109262 [Cronartium quercuum f. sp. fusiforme G11]
MIMKETPEGFKMTKEALYCFIRLMWGMVEVGAVPPPPDLNNIREFTSAFSNNDQINNVFESSTARDLVPHHEILTLQGFTVGRRKMGRYIINIQDALRIFRRVAIGGAFAYMNIKKAYIENFDLLEGAYNHYVHYVMVEKYKKEAKEQGKNVKDEERKVIQRARQRLRNARIKFATNQGYKQRYLDLISLIDAHSDDEYSETHQCYIVKTLEYHSTNANAFFEHLTQEMVKNDRLEGRRPQGQIRCRPKKPIISTIGRPPRNMPLDFYDPVWFNDLSDAQKSWVADAYRVALLPNAKLSFCPVSANDERLGDRAFNQKYWDTNSRAYNLSHVLGNKNNEEVDNEDDPNDSDYGESIDVGDTSGHEDKDDDEEEFLDENKLEADVDGDTEMFEEEDDARDAWQDALQPFEWNKWQ